MKLFYITILIGFFSLTIANEVALVKKFKGTAHVEREGKAVPIEVGTKVFQKDTIVTKSNSLVGLMFKDNTRISVGSKSKFVIEEYLFDPEEGKESFVSDLQKGSIACVTGLISKINPNAFKLKVKTASIGIRGTHFIVNADK